MCGSGTIPIEAALLARRIPPGLGAALRLHALAGVRSDGMGAARASRRASGCCRAAPAPILGSDRDAGAVAAAAANAERAGVAEDIEWRRAAISAIAPPPGRGWIVTNPPYGVRVGERRRLRDLYAQLGNVRAAVLSRMGAGVSRGASGARAADRARARAVRSATENGGIRVRLVQGRPRREPDARSNATAGLTRTARRLYVCTSTASADSLAALSRGRASRPVSAPASISER